MRRERGAALREALITVLLAGAVIVALAVVAVIVIVIRTEPGVPSDVADAMRGVQHLVDSVGAPQGAELDSELDFIDECRDAASGDGPILVRSYRFGSTPHDDLIGHYISGITEAPGWSVVVSSSDEVQFAGQVDGVDMRLFVGFTTLPDPPRLRVTAYPVDARCRS